MIRRYLARRRHRQALRAHRAAILADVAAQTERLRVLAAELAPRMPAHGETPEPDEPIDHPEAAA